MWEQLEMRKPAVRCLFLLGAIPVIGASFWCHAAMASQKSKPIVVRDLMWVWGNPEMTTPGDHTVSTFAQASPIERAALLGVPNVVMAGRGLPQDPRQAERLTKEASSASRLVWEIEADDVPASEAGQFVYAKRIAQVRKLADRYPRIEGVLLDDMTSVGIDKGFKPRHIRHVRDLLAGMNRPLRIWGVVYTMNFSRPNIDDYIEQLDVINLWTWHAKDVVDLAPNVAHLERRFPQKPIVVGLYLYDYGGGRRMPMDLLEKQCETALELAHAGRVQGIVFLTINNDPDTVGWTADWIKRVGGQKLKVSP